MQIAHAVVGRDICATTLENGLELSIMDMNREEQDIFNDQVDQMELEVYNVISQKPSAIGQTVMMMILCESYKLNGHSKYNFMKEISNCWDHYND